MMREGTRVRLIEDTSGPYAPDPECPIPTGVVLHADEHNVTVRWDQPDFLPEVDTWSRDAVEVDQ